MSVCKCVGVELIANVWKGGRSEVTDDKENKDKNIDGFIYNDCFWK